MHEMLGIALKGIPHESYRLMAKVTTADRQNLKQKIDFLREIAQTDYLDIMSAHSAQTHLALANT